MLTRETCLVCGGAFGYRWTDHEMPTVVRMCASEYNVLELSVEEEHSGHGYQLPDEPNLILRHKRGFRGLVTGLTHLSAKGLTLEAWTSTGGSARVGSAINGAMRAWLALPLAERCPS